MADVKPLKVKAGHPHQMEATDTVGVANGGTGLATVSAGGLLYGSALDVLAALAIGATGHILRVTGGLPAWSDTIPLLYLGSAPSVATPSCLGALGNHATNPVVALRQDSGTTNAQVLDLYHDYASGSGTSSFLRCYRDAAGTPLLVFNVDTRGGVLSRPQAASGTIGFAVVSPVAASIGNIYNLLSAFLLDDGANNQNWFNIATEQRVVTDGAEQGKLYVQLMAGGTLRAVWVVDEDTDTHNWLLNNSTRMLLNASFLRTSGGFKSGANSDPTAIHASAPLFAGIQPHAEMVTGTSAGTYEELVVVRHSGQDTSAVLRRLGLLLKLDAEANTTQSSRSGGLVLESSAANAANPSLFLVQGNTKRVEIDSSGNVDILGGAGKLKIGGTAVTPTAAELNFVAGVSNAIQTQLDTKAVVDIQAFTNAGAHTWTKPTTFAPKVVRVICVGAGGGGGGGASATAAAQKSGGTGGGGGACIERTFRASDLSATESVNVGTGGAGGAGGVAGGGAGTDGTTGGNSTFGTKVTAGGGGGGAGGTLGSPRSGGSGGGNGGAGSVGSSTNLSGGGAGAANPNSGASGGKGGGTGTGDAGSSAEFGGGGGGGFSTASGAKVGGGSMHGGGGGGAGAGTNATPTVFAAAAGGASNTISTGTGGAAGGSTPPTAGTAGAAGSSTSGGGGGGGGGSSSAANTAGANGGAGGAVGGGGGGGGAGNTSGSHTGGTGGAGGTGAVFVISW